MLHVRNGHAEPAGMDADLTGLTCSDVVYGEHEAQISNGDEPSN
jgi:hypothetical protein